MEESGGELIKVAPDSAEPVLDNGTWKFGNTGVELTPENGQNFWTIEFRPLERFIPIKEDEENAAELKAEHVRKYAQGMTSALKMLEEMQTGRPVELTCVTNPEMGRMFESSLGKNVVVKVNRGGGSRLVSIDVNKLLQDKPIREKMKRIAQSGDK